MEKQSINQCSGERNKPWLTFYNYILIFRGRLNLAAAANS